MIFSVLMCCNRDDGFLDEAIKSILNQTHKEFEFIIVLNNCDDELFERVSFINDNRIKLFRNKIGQLSFNLNFGIENAVGDYIVRMDSDDISYSCRLEKLNNIIKTNQQIDIIAGSADFIDECGQIIGESILNKKIKWRSMVKYKNPFIHPATAIRRDFLIAIRGYLGGFQSEDYDLWLRAANDKKTKVLICSDKHIKYRISKNQARGNLLGYAEVAGFSLREIVLRFNINNILFLFISILKTFIRKFNININSK